MVAATSDDYYSTDSKTLVSVRPFRPSRSIVENDEMTTTGTLVSLIVNICFCASHVVPPSQQQHRNSQHVTNSTTRYVHVLVATCSKYLSKEGARRTIKKYV